MQRRTEQTAGAAKFFDSALNLRCQIPRRLLASCARRTSVCDTSCGEIVVRRRARDDRHTINHRDLASLARPLATCSTSMHPAHVPRQRFAKQKVDKISQP